MLLTISLTCWTPTTTTTSRRLISHSAAALLLGVKLIAALCDAPGRLDEFRNNYQMFLGAADRPPKSTAFASSVDLEDHGHAQ